MSMNITQNATVVIVAIFTMVIVPCPHINLFLKQSQSKFLVKLKRHSFKLYTHKLQYPLKLKTFIYLSYCYHGSQCFSYLDVRAKNDNSDREIVIILENKLGVCILLVLFSFIWLSH